MFKRIYIESSIRNHPKTIELLNRYSNAEHIPCSRYGEVFNPNRQNFRIQKRAPALILAEKRGSKALPAPSEYGLGADRHFYFSHMLNCLYDCRYCFLQGMYRSANYVLFVNFDDFASEIAATAKAHRGESCIFFSGYDCDSLAMENVTGFASHMIPVFESCPNAILELRTKSVRISPLLRRKPSPNVVVAFSLNPDAVSRAQEHKAPPLASRLKAIGRLASHGWPIGLRFDPLVYFENCLESYRLFIDETFARIPATAIHSVTLGTFRAPRNVFSKMKSLYPEEPLFMGNLQLSRGQVRYREKVDRDLTEAVAERILRHVPEHLLFRCDRSEAAG